MNDDQDHIFKRDGIFYGFRENGHTGYGESGDDILCSALSAMTMLIINTVEISYGVEGGLHHQDEETADIELKDSGGAPRFQRRTKRNAMPSD